MDASSTAKFTEPAIGIPMPLFQYPPPNATPPPAQPPTPPRGDGSTGMLSTVLGRRTQPPRLQDHLQAQGRAPAKPKPAKPFWLRLLRLFGISRGNGGPASLPGAALGLRAPSSANPLNVVQVRSEPAQLTAVRAVLFEASQLPPHRRHELLSAAAEMPELSSLFTSPAAAAAADHGSLNGDTAVPPRLPELSELQEKLKGLRKRIAASPLPLPPPPQAPPKSKDQPTAATPPSADAAAPRVGEGAADAAETLPPPPGDALTLTLLPEYEQYGIAAGEAVRAVISIKAAAEARQRASVALSCVLDRSGSMCGDRIGLVRETAHFLIDQLSDRDYLGLISYSGQVREDLPLLRMTKEAKALAHAVVEGMNANGSTALYEGLAAGIRQQMEAEAALSAARQTQSVAAAGGAAAAALVHSCFLFTDGQATDGPTQPDQIMAGLRALQAPTGSHVTVHTFGFGTGHSVELLQAIAEAQSGVYYYIASSDDIAGGFGDALGGLLAVVAKDIRISIRPVPGSNLSAFRSGGRVVGAAGGGGTGTGISKSSKAARSQAQRTGTAPSTAVPSAVAFNDMFAEESRECLAVLSLPAATAPTAPVGDTAAAADAGLREGATLHAPPSTPPAIMYDVAEVDLEYTDVASGARVRRLAALRVARSGQPRPAGQIPAELVFVTASRFETVDAIEAAQAAAAASTGDDVSGAQALLDAQLAQLAAAPLQGSAALAALTEKARAARINIRPRSRVNQANAAAMAGTVQALKEQRAGTSALAASPHMADVDYACKLKYRQQATHAVNLKYYSKRNS